MRNKVLSTDGDVGFSKSPAKIRQEMTDRQGQYIISRHNSHWNYDIGNALRCKMAVRQ